MHDHEEQILDLFETDVETAFGLLYDWYWALLVGVASRYVADAAICQDIVQDSFVRVYDSIGEYKHVRSGGLLAWLKTIVIRQSLNHLNSWHERVMLRT